MPQEGVSSGNCKQANSKTTGARTTSGVIIKLDKFAGLNALPCMSLNTYKLLQIFISDEESIKKRRGKGTTEVLEASPLPTSPRYVASPRGALQAEGSHCTGGTQDVCLCW